MKLSYEANSVPQTVRIERLPDGRYAAAIGGRSYNIHAQSLRDGAWLLEIEDERLLVHSAAHGDARFVHLDGQHYTFMAANTRGRRHRSAVAAGDLTAEMPGQVMDVLVTAGDRVQRGQTLIILEAMKMEIRVTAPGDGLVRRVLVAKGDVVERGQLLAAFEAA